MLIFVYNADSGLFNTLTDIAHKLFSPQTYKCNLCALTHTPFGMKTEWRAFLSEIPEPLGFLHADEFKQLHGARNEALPAIFQEHDQRVEVWMSANEINTCRTLKELKDRIRTRLSNT
jgi:hypothetical protein